MSPSPLIVRFEESLYLPAKRLIIGRHPSVALFESIRPPLNWRSFARFFRLLLVQAREGGTVFLNVFWLVFEPRNVLNGEPANDLSKPWLARCAFDGSTSESRNS